MKIVEQSLEESNVYSLFVYAIRSQVTKDYYLRRLKIFFNYINLETDKAIEERCNYFANKESSLRDDSRTFFVDEISSLIRIERVKFLQSKHLDNIIKI
jgi:hypothetical protein